MKSTNFQLIRYDADDGHVFDWAEPHYVEVEKDGKIEKVQEHLYGHIHQGIDKDIVLSAHQRMEEAYKMDIKMESVDSRELGFQPRTLKEILEKKNF